jgi:hypothetical protein
MAAQNEGKDAFGQNSTARIPAEQDGEGEGRVGDGNLNFVWSAAILD